MELAPYATFFPTSSLENFLVIGSDKYAPIFRGTGCPSCRSRGVRVISQYSATKQYSQARCSLVQLASHDRFGFLFSSAPLAPAGPSSGHEGAYACAARAFAPNLKCRAHVSHGTNKRTRIPFFGSSIVGAPTRRSANRAASTVGGFAIREIVREKVSRFLSTRSGREERRSAQNISDIRASSSRT